MKIGDKLKIYTVLDIDSIGNPGVYKNIIKDLDPNESFYIYYLKSRFINITEQRRIKLKRLNDV